MQATGRRHTKKMKMQMFSILDNAKPGTENIKGLNYTAVKHTAVYVTKIAG
jgi:hypothetical protein